MLGRRFIQRTLVFSFVALLLACAGGPKPIDVNGHITVAGNLNPGQQGQPSPVVMRVYQLKSVGVFQTADFFAIYDQEQVSLGKDLISREEYTLQPDSTFSLQRKLDPNTRYLGVVAAFRDIEEAHWRAYVELPSPSKIAFWKKPTFRITLDGRVVSITVDD